MSEITELLKAFSNGDKRALDKLIPLVDPELRKIAHAHMRNERSGHLLQTTALVNEAFIKLLRQNVSFEDRHQFYRFVASRMRNVLIDDARKQNAAKRGSRPDLVSINEEIDQAAEKSDRLLMLEAALIKLGELDQRKVSMLECSYFIGLSDEQIAKMLGISASTVGRQLRFTRHWLESEMT